MARKEYVSTSDLADEIADWIAAENRSYRGLAEKAGVSPRAISKIVKGESPYQTVYLADSLMNAMGRYIYHLKTIWRNPHAH